VDAFLGLAADEEAATSARCSPGSPPRRLGGLEEGEVPKPRAWLRAAALRRPGRSEGRRSERSEAMGFAMRRASSAPPKSWAEGASMKA
jgi:hypothetical protein